ncbi:hypothetical protein M3Y96_00323300 [Aphelenchoides besseyi]|nr:hypothetical protein M3Y96_00323300 [Aphelenchoides besseyi]
MEVKLTARVMLLEQFKNGIDVDTAVKHVSVEVGPEVIDGQEATGWYQQFQNGNFNVSDWSSEADQELIKNGTFLQSERSIVHRFGDRWRGNLIATIDRFHVLGYSPEYFLLDSFSGTQKKIDFECLPVALEGIQMNDLKSFCLNKIVFLDDGRLLATIRHFDLDITTLSVGTFDFNNCVMKFKATIRLDQLANHELFVDEKVSILLDARESFNISTINLDDDNIRLENAIQIPRKLRFPRLCGSKLYGFNEINPLDANTLVEFSLTDQTLKEHKIEQRNQLNQMVNYLSEYIWVNNKLLLAPFDEEGKTTTMLLQFDLVDMKWTKTNMEVKGTVSNFAHTADHLIVYNNEYDGDNCVHSLYQFRLNGTETLAELTWKAMRRYSNEHRELFERFNKNLSITSRFRSMWDDYEPQQKKRKTHQ